MATAAVPSHLTRHVFRRLLANEPIVHRGCLRRQPYSSLPRTAVTATRSRKHSGTQATRWDQRRGFFNFGMFRKPKREAKEADMDPGIEKMMELERMQRLKARLPPVTDVAKALDDFVHPKNRQKRPVEDVQAKLFLLSLRYCLEPTKEGEDAASKVELSRATLVHASKAFRRIPKQITSEHLEVARMVMELLVERRTGTWREAIVGYIALLGRSGSPGAARSLLLENEATIGGNSAASFVNNVEERNDAEEPDESPEAEVIDSEVDRSQPSGSAAIAWAHLLRAFMAHGTAEDVRETYEIIVQRGMGDYRPISGAMLDFSLQQGEVANIQHWWQKFWSRSRFLADEEHGASSNTMAPGQLSRLLRWCLVEKQLELGHSVVRDVMHANPAKSSWDAVLVWAAGTGKGVDEIGRMFDVMERSNEDVTDRQQWRVPDVATINGLVDFAISRNDPYMAERFIALGRDRGIEPDAKTYVLQIEYRLSVNDIDGALIAYKNLQALDVLSDEDVPTINKLIVALCSSKRHDFDTVMNVAADLSDRRARFAPLTVSTLSLLHLDREELHDVIDLLNTHAYHYSSTERTTVRDTLVAYCLNPNTPISRSWDAYTILRNIFDELPRAPRTELMTNYFQRDRPDMAVHVFNHMRQHSRLDTLPVIETYVTAFMGCAKRHDLESLEVVHNQLKLDYNINLNTHLRNALIIAYTSCGRPRKALGFWDDVVASREGPSYNSIHIALRACERSPFGDLKAKEIFDKLRKMRIELDGTIWASYVAALVGNGDVGLAIGTLEEAERKGEVEVDEFVLGSLFAGTPGFVKQGEVEGWAKGRYPGQWAELEKVGVDEAEDGQRVFRIDRSVTP